MNRRPYLLLDVDGVLFPLADVAPPGYHRSTVWGFDVFVNDLHAEWLADLSTFFDLVWATTWEHNAVRHVGPVYRLPSDMPVIEFQTGGPSGSRKLPAVENFCADRPTAWIDDDLSADAYVWARKREAGTLLIKPDPTVGMTEPHLERLMQFGQAR